MGEVFWSLIVLGGRGRGNIGACYEHNPTPRSSSLKIPLSVSIVSSLSRSVAYSRRCTMISRKQAAMVVMHNSIRGYAKF